MLIVLSVLLHAIAFAAGAALVVRGLASAIRTFVLPRSANDSIVTTTFLVLAALFRPESKSSRPYERRDRVMALFAPIGLLTITVVWLAFVLAGYTCMYWALGQVTWRQAFTVSGSSLYTLGFATKDGLPATVLIFSEALLGLILVALLISYLPTMYAAFSRRETAVTLLHVRAGTPPSALEMLLRFHSLGRLDALTVLWATWEVWFAEVGESHTSLAALPFFRSPRPQHSWVTAAGVVLDAAALVVSVADLPRDPQAELCIRAGFMALRQIADYFGIPHNPNPAPGDPISIHRSEFDEVYDRLAAAGFPVLADRDAAWQSFAGWRVNYDVVLLTLADLTMAPPVPWVSDRTMLRRRTLFSKDRSRRPRLIK